MQNESVVYCGYNFKVLEDGSILFDRELDSSKINLNNGDKFEVLLVPDMGILLQKCK